MKIYISLLFATIRSALRAPPILSRDPAWVPGVTGLSAKGPFARSIDLGIAIGSAAKTAALLSVDCRCQTRIATAARKLGVIQADTGSPGHRNVSNSRRNR